MSVVLPGAGNVTSNKPEAFLDLSVKTGALVPTDKGIEVRIVINGNCNRGSWLGIAVQVLIRNPKTAAQGVRFLRRLKAGSFRITKARKLHGWQDFG
jgi:hypothetical protein